LSDTSSGVQ